MTTTRVPRVLSIAGTDPTGGAGIHADLKSIGALGGYGMAVVTTVVAQNTQGVRSVHAPPVDVLEEQLNAVSDDVEIDAVKLGMLHSVAYVDVVSAWLTRTRPPLVVLDPVMVATSGDRLLDVEEEKAVRELCRQADLVTPNVPELAVLTGQEPATTWAEAVAQAELLAAEIEGVVLLKGGHLAGETCSDAVVSLDGVHEVEGRRIASTSTHGTGCSLSSAMATLGAQGLSWTDALVRAKDWLAGAIEHGAALDVGHGHGPVDHFHELRPARGWCEERWAATGAVRRAIDECPVVTGLRDGDLARERFAHYLAQDRVYLGEYSRALARASAMAPTADEQVFWATSAAAALQEEATLHRRHTGDAVLAPEPATVAYTDHLHAASTRGYPELVAALLPCFWIYSDLGTRFTAANRPGHPYGDWLSTYGDPAFAASTLTAMEIADRAAGQASDETRRRMARAFDVSTAHELAFFEAF